MNKIFIGAAALAAVYATEIKQTHFLMEEGEVIDLSSTTACQFYENYSWYSFIPTDVTTVNYYTSTSDTHLDAATAYFTYCQDLSNTQTAVCSESNYAAVYTGGECTLNSSSIKSTTMTYQGEETFALVYTNDDSSTNGGVTALYVAQDCDSSQTSPETEALSSNDDGTEYYTSQKSNMACPVFTVNALIQFVDDYAWMFGTGFIVIGLFLAFLGRKLFNVALFIVSTIIVAGLILFIFYATFLKDNTASWVSWTVVSIAILLGLLGGYLMVKVEKLGGAVLAGWGGFCLGVLLNETVLYLANSAVLFWCVNIGLAVIFAILGFVAFDHAIILATSFIGSYMTMRGIGIMAGGFPNEYVLINEIEAGAFDNIDPVFYAYLAGIVIMTILAAIVQYKMYRKQQTAEAHPYAKLN